MESVYTAKPIYKDRPRGHGKAVLIGRWSLYTGELEALGERRPPWPRQIITPILSTVKMLNLGCERLPQPPKKKKKKKKKKGSGSLPSPRSGYATTYYGVFLLIYSSYNTQITTKIESVLTCTTQDPSIKFHPNPFITF